MNILYATDGSGAACVAGRLLASLPLPVETRVTVLTAVPGDDWVESMIFIDTTAQQHRHIHWLAQCRTEEGTTLLRERGVPVDCSLASEEATVAILKRAEAEHTDLIAVGCHEKGRVERFLHKSVSERVARYAHTSVLVARRERVERVVVAVDGSEASEHAIDALLRLPLPAEVAITLVYVEPAHEKSGPTSQVSSPEYKQLEDEYAAERLTRAEQIVRHAEQRLLAAGRPAEVQIREGAAAAQLIEAAQELEADLVVVGSANRSALGRLFLGSVSAQVLSHVPCSVLVARLAPLPASAEAPAPDASAVSL